MKSNKDCGRNTKCEPKEDGAPWTGPQYLRKEMKRKFPAVEYMRPLKWDGQLIDDVKVVITEAEVKCVQRNLGIRSLTLKSKMQLARSLACELDDAPGAREAIRLVGMDVG